MATTIPLERARVRARALVMRFGRTSTAFSALGPGVRWWFDDATEALVAYVDTGGAWVAAGEPVSRAEDAIGVAERFVDAATRVGRRSCFFATEGILAASPRFRRTLIGEQPVWDPARWDAAVRGHRSMREQLRRARAKGVTVERWTPTAEGADDRVRTEIDAVVARWLAQRPMAAMRFLVDVAPLAEASLRRLWVARVHGAPIGVISLAPVPARDGWLFEFVLRDPGAPNGSAELMVDTAMRAIAADGARWASLGLAPLAGNVEGWLSAARSLSRPLFNFAGLWAFKRKLRPDRWEPIYLAYPRERHSAMAMLDGLRAFAGGSLVTFALRTALRGPRPLVQLLVVLLVPWTIGLALVPTSPWFPSVSFHRAWVIFDLLLLFLLAVLLPRTRGVPRRLGTRLAALIAGIVSLDAVLTVVQAIVWTIPALRAEGRGAGSYVAVALACAGPMLAAPVLWGGVRRLHRLERTVVRRAPEARIISDEASATG